MFDSRLRDFTDHQLSRLASRGFTCTTDFLLWLPTGYLDLTRTVTGERSMPGSGHHLLTGTVAGRAIQKPKNPLPHPLNSDVAIHTLCTMKVGNFKVVVASHKKSAHPLSGLRYEESIFVFGLIKRIGKEFYLFDPQPIPEAAVGTVMPVYQGIHSAMTPSQVHDYVQDAMKLPGTLAQAADNVYGQLGDDKLNYSVESIEQTLSDAHRPADTATATQAMQILRFMNVHSLAANTDRSQEEQPESIIETGETELAEILSHIPFDLSPSQSSAFDRILAGLRAAAPLNMLLSGDVGSGKSIVQFLALAAAHKAGRVSAITAPNEILAQQLYIKLQATFPYPCRYIGGGKTLDPEQLDQSPILVGTTAIVHAVKKHNLELAVVCIDEQQKMGIEQKAALTGPNTNLIESTATCIPRSMGHVVLGNMQVARLEGHADKHIQSIILSKYHRGYLFKQIHQVVAEGGRVAVIYSEVNETKNSRSDRSSLLKTVPMWEKQFPGQVISLHGQLSSQEKEDRIKQVLAGECQILVATSIIEIGLDADIQMLVAIDPDRFGASTLHQMRGRVQRGGGHGLFVMYCTKEMDEKTEKRLEMVRDHNNGFIIAEEDMKARGIGDVFGAGQRQSGKTVGVFFGTPIEVEDFNHYYNSKTNSDSGTFGEK